MPLQQSGSYSPKDHDRPSNPIIDAYGSAIAAWNVECRRIKLDNAALVDDWKRRNAMHLKRARTARGRPQVHKIYAATMSSFQDAYYEAVGKPSGLLRDGPRQARRSTKAHAADKKQAKRIADEIDRTKQQAQKMERMAEALKVRTQSLKLRQVELAEAVDAMTQIIDAVETGTGCVVDGKLHLPRLSPLLDRLSQPIALRSA